MPPVDPKYRREWAEGVSVYDNLDYALGGARRDRSGLGRFVVAIVAPDDGSVEILKTMRNRRHYTIYASGGRILEMLEMIRFRLFLESRTRVMEDFF